MAYEKQTWISYDDNKTEEQNIQDGAVVTAERMNHIEQGLVEHEKDKENPHEVTAHQVGALTAEESSVNVIYQVIGKEKVIIKINADFEGKQENSFLENPNLIRRTLGGEYGRTDFIKPTDTNLREFTTDFYKKVVNQDGDILSFSSNNSNAIAQAIATYDLVAISKIALGNDFFETLNLNEKSQQVSFLKSKITKLKGSCWGYGVGALGNTLTLGSWNYLADSWVYRTTSFENKISKLTSEIPKDVINQYIDNEGKYHNLSHSIAASENQESALHIDCLRMEFEIELSVHDFINSMIAAYRRENIDTSFMKISSLANGADDWNNYTEIGTYGITVGTGANAPVNSTGTLLVQGYGAGGTGRTQLFINSNSIRYRQYQGGGNWTTWQALSNIGQTDNKYMNINTTLVKAQDWNTLDTVGTYSVEGANGDNRPSINDTWGTLLVQSSKHSSSMLTQLFISSGNIYFRRKSGEATWGPWHTPIPEIASGAEIDTGTNNTKMVTPQGLATSYYSKYIAIGAWTTLTLNTGFKSADNTTVKYRILEYPQPNGAVKNKIEFDGAWTNDAGSLGSSSGTQSQWCILPENLRPAQTKMFPAQCSKFSTTGRIAFTPNGICYGAQDSGAAVTYMYVTGMSYWIGE